MLVSGAHHRGDYIRLAFADHPEGPWTIHEPGALHLDQTAATHHIASPDVLVDAAAGLIRMYFHGPVLGEGQKTFVATSVDGLTFTASEQPLGLPYFRAFEYNGAYYAVGKRGATAGVHFRSPDGLQPFEEGPDLIPRMRHAELHRDGDRLTVFYSRIGDTPERLLRSVVELGANWRGWTAGPALEVLRPTEAYEGAQLPIATSVGGPAEEALHELRDPGLLVEASGQYLYYSVAAKQGIALARFTRAR